MTPTQAIIDFGRSPLPYADAYPGGSGGIADGTHQSIERRQDSGGKSIDSFSRSILYEISSGLKKKSKGGEYDDVTRRYVKKQLNSLLDERLAALKEPKDRSGYDSSESRRSMLRGNALNISMSSK